MEKNSTFVREKLSYENKLILAPMVRIGTLPMRLLALEYGADIVYTEEIVDWKLLRSLRRENGILGTIDYIDKTDGSVVFRTCPREKNHVVLQIGTSDSARALCVGKMVQGDVAAIDINMGCPKKFSILGGMGAALLREPQTAKEILQTLVNGLSIPITCKIRVLPNFEDTMELCRILVSSGIAAIAIHGRTIDERPQHPNRDEVLRCLSKEIPIPVIANGGSRDIQKHTDIYAFQKKTGCNSVMIARAAEWNCSIFRKDGLLPIDDIIKAYLKYSIDYDNPPSNTKYCVQNILRDLQETPRGKKFLMAQALEQICDVWNMRDYCVSKKNEYREKGYFLPFRELSSRSEGMECDISCKRKRENDQDVALIHCVFLRNNYINDCQLPKTKLLKWTRENKKKMPHYNTLHENKLFRSIVTVDGKKYGSTFWEKNKKSAEQGAAQVCLYSLGIIDEKELNGILVL